MNSQKIYCEVEFLKKFIELRPTALAPTEENVNSHKTWINLFEFIFKSNLIFDDSANFAKKSQENDFFKILWKKSIDSANKLDFLNDDFPKLDNFEESVKNKKCSLSSMYLTISDDDICESIQNKFGVLALNINLLNSRHSFFTTKVEGLSFGTSSHSNWNFIESNRHACNSLCISDNYILSETENVDNNLLPILDKLLPSQLSIPFHISIFTLKNEGDQLYLNFIEKYIIKKIKELRPINFEFILGIYESNKRDFHDRAIMTNYMIIESGAGFDIFKKDKNDINKGFVVHKTKIMSYFYHFTDNVSLYFNNKSINLYDFMMSSLKKRYNKENKMLKDKKMKRENRLFEQ